MRCFARVALWLLVLSSPAVAGMNVRPTLVLHDGRYFRWSAPVGWSEQETTNGVSLLAPDGVTSVSSVILMRSTGNPRPHDFAARMLGMDQSIRGLSVLSSKALPDQPSGMGVPWKVEEVEMRYVVNGIPLRATWTVGIASVYGRFDAFMLGYQAPDTVFETAKLWLAPIARSVTVTNPAQIAGNDRVILPKNNPLDNSGLIESWRQKGLSEDRISKAQREGMMGYERVKDSAGNYYNMPLETWDATVGGYRNPRHPNEILQRTGPGE
jgi:hypothetical protein